MWEAIIFFGGATIVSTGCLIPARWLPPLPNDKLLHFLAFGGLTLCAGYSSTSSRELLLSMAIVFSMGLFIEILQMLVPGRRFCWRDLIANAAGIASAGIIIKLIPSV